MAPRFTIQNRQRRLNLKDLKLVNMAESIGTQVCRNLTDDSCPWLNASQIAQIQDQGAFSLVFVSDRKIKEMNKQWRGKNYATDVLSFPLELEPMVDGIPYDVGEIVISVDRALDQSKEYGHSLEREIAFLITHGILHVLGFDHQTKEEEKEMFGRQKKILKKCGYLR